MYWFWNTKINNPQMHNYTVKNKYGTNRVRKLYSRVATQINYNTKGILQTIITTTHDRFYFSLTDASAAGHCVKQCLKCPRSHKALCTEFTSKGNYFCLSTQLWFLGTIRYTKHGELNYLCIYCCPYLHCATFKRSSLVKPRPHRAICSAESKPGTDCGMAQCCFVWHHRICSTQQRKAPDPIPEKD